MKATRLIEILQSIVDEQGDREVMVPSAERAVYSDLDSVHQWQNGGTVYLSSRASAAEWSGFSCKHRVYGPEAEIVPAIIRQYRVAP